MHFQLIDVLFKNIYGAKNQPPVYPAMDCPQVPFFYLTIFLNIESFLLLLQCLRMSVNSQCHVPVCVCKHSTVTDRNAHSVPTSFSVNSRNEPR